METRIIDTPRTVTVADIAPGKEFIDTKGVMYTRVRSEPQANINAVRMSDWSPVWVGTLVPVEPCEPSTPATCTFGELEPGDLFNLGSQPTSQVYQKQMDACPNAVNLTSDHTCKIRNDEIVTPLEQVEPLVLRTRS